MQTLLTCVFHLKSLAIVTLRYLMLSTFSRSVPSKVYEAWIFLIRFLVSCITSLPRNPIDQYHPEVSLCLLHPEFHDSKHSHQQKVLFQTQYLMRCHLCTKRTTRDQERCPRGHPTKPEPSQILLHLQLVVA